MREAVIPKLSVGILASKSHSCLPQLLASVTDMADEIIVGVDAESSNTLELASKEADVFFRVEHTAFPEAAKMLFLEHATGDWILQFNDNELINAAFVSLMPRLLGDVACTHYYFPRKWVVNLEPMQYVRALPWYPDWQLRLFRNNQRLVWHSGRVNENYKVMGLGRTEEGTSILNFELMKITEEQRAAKLARYRESGGTGTFEEFYAPIDGYPPTRLEAPPAASKLKLFRELRRNVVPGIYNVTWRKYPPWKARLGITMSESASSGDHLFVRVDAFNSGLLTWMRYPRQWPNLCVSYHVYDASGKLLVWDGERTPITSIVETGDKVSIFAFFIAPKEPGEYMVEWDMVSEDECWFAECGSPTEKVRLRVTP